ncbi:DNA-binding protein H-NS [Crenobacter luteus]|uniref:KorB protein n=1 Tax=Crenobacter luteus TaxID=1452487 RepID=A0A161SIU9_9NEIS|nr:H-NS histone family protein [Crenobacter luteus]KZE33880.1 KorB protein [Crenobacter luteus]TCP15768.1 DNA-binding protein H-NS [Crenobacter luteus]
MELVQQLPSLEYADLIKLRNEVESELKRRESEEKAKARKQIQEIAKTYGLNLEEVLSKTTAVVRKPVEAKYVHPQDASLTWTGRGRKPSWVQALLDQGHQLDELLIRH